MPGPQARRLKLWSANITAWSAAATTLLDGDADLCSLQEMHVAPCAAAGAQREAARKGWKLALGDAKQQDSLLGFMHRERRLAARQIPMEGLAPEQQARIQLVAVFLGDHRVIHVLNLYGRPGGARDQDWNAQLVLAAVSWQRSLGQTPALLMGDLNLDLAESGLAGVLGLSGWTDLLQDAGETCLPSRGQARRLDYVLCNEQARGMVHGARLRWDMGIPTHALLEVLLDIGDNPLVPRRQPVPSLAGPALSAWTALVAEQARQELIREHEAAFRVACEAGAVERAWQHLEAAATAWLAKRAGLPEQRRPYAHVVWQRCWASAAGDGDATTHALSRALLRKRRLQGLQHALNRTHPSARQVWGALQRDQDAAWQQRFLGPLPNADQLACMLHDAEKEVQQQVDLHRRQRQESWHSWAQECWSNQQGKLYRWLRDGGNLGRDMVITTDFAGQPGTVGWVRSLKGGPHQVLAQLDEALSLIHI